MLIRKRYLPLLFLLLLLPATSMAQNPDTVYVFRFVSHKDMFYIPWKGNDTQFNNLLSLIETHKTVILKGDAPLLVDGYCASEPMAAENLKLAKIRSNRVKSELILTKGVTESCFITHNHAEPYEDLKQVVIVRLRLPKIKERKEVGMKGKETPEVTPDIPQEETPEVTPDIPQKETATEKAFPHTSPSETTDTQLETSLSYPRLGLRANLLRWATLTPDLGIEWRVNHHLGILVNGSWTSWSWNHKNRRYALWNISPEMRYYLGKHCRGFLGVMYHTGEFHYKLRHTGCQGDYQGGGLTGGYLLNLNRSFSLDLHTGVGYTHADSSEYTLINDVRVRKDSKTKNYWGINQLGITLIWKILK